MQQHLRVTYKKTLSGGDDGKLAEVSCLYLSFPPFSQARGIFLSKSGTTLCENVTVASRTERCTSKESDVEEVRCAHQYLSENSPPGIAIVW